VRPIPWRIGTRWLLVLIAVAFLAGWTWQETHKSAATAAEDPLVVVAPYKILPSGEFVFELDQKRLSLVTDEEISRLLAPPPLVECGSSRLGGNCCNTSVNAVPVTSFY